MTSVHDSLASTEEAQGRQLTANSAPLRRDPPARPDGLCHVCQRRRGRIPKTLVKRSAAELAKNLAADPFCSSECARIYHGCPLPTVGPQGGSTSKEFRHGTEYGYDQGCREDCCRKASYEARKARREKAAA